MAMHSRLRRTPQAGLCYRRLGARGVVATLGVLGVTLLSDGVGHRLRSMVLPDSKLEGPRGELGGTSTIEEQASFKSRVQQWAMEQDFAPHDLADGGRKAEKQQRVANKFWLAGLDHALCTGVGLGLKDFVPLRRARPLGATEQRYLVDEATLVAGSLPGARSRACIWDRGEQKKSCLELPQRSGGEGGCLDRELILTIDQGSVGWQGVFFLSGELGLAGFFSRRPVAQDMERLALGARSFLALVRHLGDDRRPQP